MVGVIKIHGSSVPKLRICRKVHFIFTFARKPSGYHWIIFHLQSSKLVENLVDYFFVTGFLVFG